MIPQPRIITRAALQSFARLEQKMESTRPRNLVRRLQAATNAAVTALVQRLKRKVPLDNLCFAGGVALNCVTNELIKQWGDFSDVFIPSAPHDAGTAVGAAFVVHCAQNRKAIPSAANVIR